MSQSRGPRRPGAVFEDQERLSVKEPETTANFVLANDGSRVTVADAMLVGEPVGPLIAAQERRTGLQVAEPLGQLAAGRAWDASYEAFVGVGGVRQRHWHLRSRVSRFQSSL